MAEVKKELFEKLEYRNFKIKDNVDNKYLVYKDKENFSVIEASSAGEAIEKGQVAEPYMVIHYDAKSKPFFNKEDLEEVSAIKEEVAESTEPKNESASTSEGKEQNNITN